MIQLPSRVLALDFETTGLVPAYDHPTSIGAVVFEDGEPTGETFRRSIMPGDKSKMSLEAMFVQTGTMAELRQNIQKHLERVFPDDAITAKECLVELQEWTHSNRFNILPVVAQKASFDWGFYEEKLCINRSVHLGNVLSPVWICTKTLACHVSPDKSKKDLNSLCAFLGIPPRESIGHDSYEDALKCGYVYYALKARLEGK